VAGPHRVRPRAGPHARTLGTLAWVPITQLTGFCVLTDIGAAKGEGQRKERAERTAEIRTIGIGVEVSLRVLIKINERVLNQDGVLIKVNERNNSDIIKAHARAEPPCSCRAAGWDAARLSWSRVRPGRFRFARQARRAGDRLGYGSQVDAPANVFELSTVVLVELIP